jgi:hypothetical protein
MVNAIPSEFNEPSDTATGALADSTGKRSRLGQECATFNEIESGTAICVGFVTAPLS